MAAVLSSHSWGQSSVHFRDIGLEEALDLSRIEKKPVFFMGFAEWCGHCNEMKQHVLTDSAVANFYTSHFICFTKDLEKDDGVSLGKKFHVKSYPVFVFLDSNGTTLYQVVGEFKAENFIDQGRNALNPQKQLPYLRCEFEAHPSDSLRCYNYILALLRAGLELKQPVNTYFATQSDQQLLNEMNWKIINIGISDMQSREFQFVLSHQKEFGVIVTPAKVERKIFRTVAYNLQPLANTNDTLLYFEQRRVAEAIHLFPVDSIILTFDLMVYETNNKWNAYQSSAFEGTEKYFWQDYAQLRHIADIFLKHVTDIMALKKASVWAKRSVEIKSEYGNSLLLAKLLEKCGDLPGARQAAEQAKEIAGRTNANTAEADQLLLRVNGGK
jgi:thiol-disulfide isomerase/thioredoxin